MNDFYTPAIMQDVLDALALQRYMDMTEEEFIEVVSDLVRDFKQQSSDTVSLDLPLSQAMFWRLKSKSANELVSFLLSLNLKE